MKKENLAIIEMLVCAVLWSIAGIFIKLIPWNAFALAGLRGLIAGLTMGVYMACKRYRFRLNRQTFVTGVLACCCYTLFICANKLTTAANAIVLQFTNPVFIVLFSALFLKSRVRRADLLVVVLTLLGIALFFLDQLKPGYVAGNITAIVSGMFMAGMYLTVSGLEIQERFSAIVTAHFLTFLVGLPFLLSTEPVFDFVSIGSILVLGVLQLGISYILYVRASVYCPPLACSLLAAVEPLLNPLWVLLFNGERPGVFALIGAVIVVTSVTLWCIFGQEKTVSEKSNA